MYKRINYVKTIESLQDEDTINLIGNIDIKSVELLFTTDLLYVFPLIERIIVEIYKFTLGASIEDNEQGKRKTICAIIEKNEANGISVLLPSMLEEINFYFKGEEALRNVLFHPKRSEYSVEYDPRRIQKLLLNALLILKYKIKKYDFSNLKEIEKL